jgi:hypothetical protein
MNALSATDIAITSEDTAPPPVMDTIRSPRELAGLTPSLSSEQEAFLCEHYSTKLEDPRTGRWIHSWRTEG